MKSIITFIIGISISVGGSMVIMAACDDKHPQVAEEAPKTPPRINLVATRCQGVCIYLIDIDGHLYGTTSSGGLLHLESCDCKRGISKPQSE